MLTRWVLAGVALPLVWLAVVAGAAAAWAWQSGWDVAHRRPLAPRLLAQGVAGATGWSVQWWRSASGWDQG